MTATRMWLKPIILFSVLITHFVIAEDVGDPCVPNNQVSEGICTLVSDCEPAKRLVMTQRFHNFMRCGFYGAEEIVCCPDPHNKFGLTENTSLSQRIAVRECEKIINSSIPALGLYILGGVEATLGEFPHMVALGYDRGDDYVFDCGGSVLSKTFVLTAAHCVDTIDGIAPTIVRAGVVELGSRTWNDETDVNIAQIILHPNYTRQKKYHDLALLRLQKSLTFNGNLNAVCLETSTENPNVPLLVTGWGKTNNTRDIRSDVLLKAIVRAAPSDVCGKSYTNWRKLPDGISSDQICAGDPKGINDTCQGDSGGPMQLAMRTGQYKLVGVTSFGLGCGSKVPAVYARVSRYLDWIESVVWPN